MHPSSCLEHKEVGVRLVPLDCLCYSSILSMDGLSDRAIRRSAVPKEKVLCLQGQSGKTTEMRMPLLNTLLGKHYRDF